MTTIGTMKAREAAIAMAACPRCAAPIGTTCATPTGRNHGERIRASIAAALEALKPRRP